MKWCSFLVLACLVTALLSSCASAKKEACSSCSACALAGDTKPGLNKDTGMSALKKAAAATPQGQAVSAGMKAADAAQKARQ